MYKIWLYKELKTEYGYTKVEIFKKGYTGVAIEIGAIPKNSISISLENLTEITSPIAKSVCSFSIYDIGDVDYEDFFTPSATKFKVVVSSKIGENGSYNVRWSGYITPDFFAENLTYRTSIQLSARDNIGYLAEVDFDLTDTYISVGSLIRKAFEKIDTNYPMQVQLLAQKQSNGVNIFDSIVDTTIFKEESWYFAIETLLHDLGLQMRWVDNNTIAVLDLSQLPEYFATSSFYFADRSGYREISPALRTFSQTQDYGVKENFFDGDIKQGYLTYRKTVEINTPELAGLERTKSINYYTPNNWGVLDNETFTINPADYDLSFNRTIYFTGLSKPDEYYTSYMAYDRPVNISQRPLKITFKMLNSVQYPTDAFTEKLSTYDPSKDSAPRQVDFLQLGLKCNVILHGENKKTYLLRNSWVEYSGVEQQCLSFVLPRVEGGKIENSEFIQGKEPNEEEISINVATIPVGGRLEFRLYGFYIVEKHNYWEDDFDLRDIKIDWTKCVTYIKDVTYTFESDEIPSSQTSNITVNEEHNVARKESYKFGQVPNESGSICAYAGGLYSPLNYDALIGFKRNENAALTYNLLELVGREQIHFNRKNYNILSGTIRNLDKQILGFNQLYVREGKTYLPYNYSLNVIANEMTITAMQEVEPYETQSFTEVQSEVNAKTGTTVSVGNNNTALQYSEDIGNAKRIYELDMASENDLQGASMIIDKDGLPEARRFNISEIINSLGVVGINENNEAVVKNNRPLLGDKAKFNTLVIPTSAPTNLGAKEWGLYISNTGVGAEMPSGGSLDETELWAILATDNSSKIIHQSHIPTIGISKVSGLQNILNKKLEASALSDYQPLITSSNKLAYSLISGTPTLANVATSGKYSDLTGTPTSLKNPYALTFGTKTYDGSSAKTITASDLGALTSHQDISHLLSKTDAANTYATLTSLATTNNNISTLQGYFTNGSANNALKLGGIAAANYWHTSNAGSKNYDWSANVLRMNTLVIPTSVPSGLASGEWAFYLSSSGVGAEIPSGGGLDVAELWAELGLEDSNKVINASHIPMLGVSRISGLQTILNNKADASALSSYLLKSGGTITNDLHINGYLSTQKTWLRLGAYYLIAGTTWKVTDASWQNEYTLYHTGNLTKLSQLTDDVVSGKYQPLITSNNKLAYSLISGTPVLASVATSGKYSDLSGVPTSLPASDVYAWAKAASKPTYTASEVGALSTSGGTITSTTTTATPLVIISSAANAAIRLKNASIGSYIGVNSSGNWFVTDNTWASTYTLIHSGNIGSQSVSKANSLNEQYVSNLDSATYGRFFSGAFQATNTPASNYATGLTLYNVDLGYNYQLAFSTSGNIHTRYKNTTTWQDWKTIAFTSDLADYLPLIGGTITSESSYAFNVKCTSSSKAVAIGFMRGDSDTAYLDYRGNSEWRASGNTLIHSGNIAEQSVNIANSAGYLFGKVGALKATERGNLDYTYALYTGGWDVSNLGYATSYGTFIDLSGYSTWYHRLAFNTNGTLEHFMGINTKTLSKVGDIAYTSSNVASATKLQTARTIWGQSFNGTGNVSGVMSVVEKINFVGDWMEIGLVRNSSNAVQDLIIQANGSKPLSINPNGGNVLIGTTTDSGAKLQVNGGIHSLTGSSYLFGYGTSTVTSLSALDNVTAIGAGKDSWNIYMWSFGNGKGCIQVSKSDDTTRYALLLQPFGGYVGIGTPNPSYSLDVNGTFNAGASKLVSLAVSGVIINDNYKLYTGTINPRLELTDGTTTMYAQLYNSQMGIGPGSGKGLYIKTNGYTGVNTNNPQYPLDVNGSAKISGEMDANALVIPTAPPTNPQAGKHYLYLA